MRTLTKSLGNLIEVVRKMALKGRTPTKDEKKHMDDVSRIGCIVCRKLGLGYIPAEIHHINGKTQPLCHFQVLPLCYEHHQGQSGIHHNKTIFESKYGKEIKLLERVIRVIYKQDWKRIWKEKISF